MSEIEKLRAAMNPLPCPFCGENLVVKSDHHGEWLGHRNDASNCECAINQLFDVDDVKRWNTRAHLPPIMTVPVVIEMIGRRCAEWEPDEGAGSVTLSGGTAKPKDTPK